jgi:hypothetical protein
MTEDKFEKFLKQTAQDYNAPPARVPREEMWSAIQAKRAAGPQVVYGGGLVPEATPARKFGTRVWLGAAAAAMLLVATGVGIGRWTAAPASRVATTLPANPVVVAPPETGSSAPVTGSDAPSTGSDATPASGRETAVRGPNNRGANDTRATLRSPGQTAESRVATGANTYPQQPSSAYQLTTVRHLSEAEALLTSFRQRTTSDQQMDAQLGSWARQLLSNTRLLLDSPVANDPQRRPLLQDLEMILVQIVQLSPGSAPQDRDMIEKTLQQEHVLTRLRTAIPAGSQRGS